MKNEIIISKGIYQQKCVALPREREKVNVKFDDWIIPGFITSQCGFNGEKKIHKINIKRVLVLPTKLLLVLASDKTQKQGRLIKKAISFLQELAELPGS